MTLTTGTDSLASPDPDPVPLVETVERIRARAAARAYVHHHPSVDDSEIDFPDVDLAGVRADVLAARRVAAWASTIPSRFVWAQCDDFEDPVRSKLSAWACAPRPSNLVLAGGDTGVGKTHAAVAAVRPAHDAGHQVRFYPVVELLDLLRPGGPEGILFDLAEVDRLIVDDLASEKPTDWTTERLYSLINRRWLNEVPTVFTTNVSAKGLRELYGDRTYSRLVGSGATVLHLTGEDRRLRRG